MTSAVFLIDVIMMMERAISLPFLRYVLFISVLSLSMVSCYKGDDADVLQGGAASKQIESAAKSDADADRLEVEKVRKWSEILIQLGENAHSYQLASDQTATE